MISANIQTGQLRHRRDYIDRDSSGGVVMLVLSGSQCERGVFIGFTADTLKIFILIQICKGLCVIILMNTYLFYLICVFCLSGLATSEECTLQDDQFFVTFHPHLDAFWLNYDNELKDINFRPAGFLYNMNQRNSKTIFNSMLKALTQNQTRKYFVTEVVFFKDWYDYLNNEDKLKVKNLLDNGQLQIGNAAWVENDQAVCYYDDILDQYTLGNNFLYAEFKYENKVAWATDSFGHSHSQAALEHLLGIEFQGIERVDDRYINQHKDKPLLEFYWVPVSDSNNMTYGGVLNQVRHFLHEVNDLRGARGNFIVSDFEKLKVRMDEVYGKNKYFRFLGNDFEEFISEEFTNLQNAFGTLNNKITKQKCPMYKYGNPDDYLKTIESYYEKNILPTRKHDFIPNWDQDRYWTGYYTTDPLLKKTCKDFSRLVNLYRKVLVATRDSSKGKFDTPLMSAEQLLAVVQHHDGITATSKTYIEDEFKNRMVKKSRQVLQMISQIFWDDKEVFADSGRPGSAGAVICELLKGNNKCSIPQNGIDNFKTLNIITYGNGKKQKIQLELSDQKFYILEKNNDFDIFCEEKPSSKCTLVFEATLLPGINQFLIVQKDFSQIQEHITILDAVPELTHSGRDYTITLTSQSTLKYEYNAESNNYLEFGFYTSVNKGSSRKTMSWDKYGKKTDKTEHVVPGMYIMSNTGKIEPLAGNGVGELKVGEGRIYKKALWSGKGGVSRVEITIENEKPDVVDVVFDFKPPGRNMLDYFLKVQSPIKSDTLYHDSNGFLVSKRILNSRPDYTFEAKSEDLINGNTYPACSFAYLVQNQKKMVFFSDRAQGVASYNQSLLINFDRLAMDDGKGVGEGYSRINSNVFHYKFGIVGESNPIERRWQREYDEGMLGYLSTGSKKINQYTSEVHRDNYLKQSNLDYLKYSTFILNANEIVLRFQNLHEFNSIQIPKFANHGPGSRWTLEGLGLDVSAAQINESYANGIPLQKEGGWRKNFSKIAAEVSLFAKPKDGESTLTLRPLEIRSFRVNFKDVVQKPSDHGAVGVETVKNPVKVRDDALETGYKGKRKRCFL